MPPDLLSRLLNARSTAQVEAILGVLPVVSPDDYQWVSADDRSSAGQQGKLHWVPVGLDRGNGGRIKLAGEPMNPIAERMVNGMESLIELVVVERDGKVLSHFVDLGAHLVALIVVEPLDARASPGASEELGRGDAS
jgi:hypothetical protein